MRSKNYHTKLRKLLIYPQDSNPFTGTKKAPRAKTNTAVEQELEAAGWKPTKNGRWINPKDGKSFNAIEASVLVEEAKYCCVCGTEENQDEFDSVGKGRRKRWYCSRCI